MDPLVAYLVTAMVGWVPLHAQRVETASDARARYESIASDVASVVLDDDEAPVLPGPDGRAQTALLMLSVASFESGFRKAVDDGVGRGDHGRSYCLMQIRIGQGVTSEGWTADDLIRDRRLCFRAALHILRRSFGVCHALPLDDRLAAYASGQCLAGASASRTRVGRARLWWQAHVFAGGPASEG